MRQQVFQNGFWRKQLFEIFDIEKPFASSDIKSKDLKTTRQLLSGPTVNLPLKRKRRRRRSISLNVYFTVSVCV